MQQRASERIGDGSSGRRAWLLALLGLALASHAFDEVVGSNIAATLRISTYSWLFYALTASQLLGLVAAGIALDRFGIRRTIGVSLLVWAALTAGSAIVAASPQGLHVLAHAATLFVGLFFGLGLCVAAKPAFALTGRGLALAVLNLAASVWLILVPTIAAGLGWPSSPPAQPFWAQGCLIASGAAAFLAILWWLTYRRPEGPASQALELGDRTNGGASFSDAAALFRRPGIWALVVVMTCHMLVFAVIYRVFGAYVLRERLVASDAFFASLALPVLAWTVAQIAFAVWSDARARTKGLAAPARVPFIIVGAVLTSSIGLLPLVGRDHFGLVYWMVAAGMAAFPLSATFAFDIIPKALSGRFFGLAWALGLALNTAIFLIAILLGGPRHSMASFFYLAGLASLLAAVLTFIRLRKLEPIEDGPGFVGTIGEVFA